ncbi:MAG: imidazoleglycerol-phosphate dehydratase HisB [Clostridia bacterium]|nr:imidazoleglycerol-phosphate dehydratase HisB [Clostridia bacterium]
MRIAEIKRTTSETDISIKLNLDGSGKYNISSGSGFLDHMLQLLAVHGRLDLDIDCKGDTHVDMHHSAEDIGIALGDALAKALGDKAGICRYADILLPMDEALIMCALDVSGRSYLNYDVVTYTDKVGDFDCELVKEFMLALVRRSGITLHFKMFAGENSHHIIEAVFKSLGRTLRAAVSTDISLGGAIPSSKGVL